MGDWLLHLSPVRRDAEFVSELRMSYPTFQRLCALVGPRVEKQDTVMRKAVSVEKRVAIAVYRLAHCSSLKNIARHFGVGKSTVQEMCTEVYTAIIDCLRDEYVVFPTGDRLRAIMSKFERKYQMPMVAGAVDGSHIPIHPADVHHADYLNRKGWFSVVLQACVDCDGLVIDYYVGWPGKAHDARVWKESPVYAWARDGDILRDVPTRQFGGQAVQPFILGDAAYPCDRFCIPALKGPLSIDQHWFNYNHSRARMVVERAFGRLKARWRILAVPVYYKDMGKHIAEISACCILHNFVQMHGEPFLGSWLEEVAPGYMENLPEQAAAYEDEVVGNTLRAALVQHMVQYKPQGWVRRAM
jgi:transposase